MDGCSIDMGGLIECDLKWNSVTARPAILDASTYIVCAWGNTCRDGVIEVPD